MGMRIEIAGLHKHFVKSGHRIDVLADIDIEIAAGESVSIVGESGSGKSTFLHILGTLERPSDGTVRFDGREVFSSELSSSDPPGSENTHTHESVKRVGFTAPFVRAVDSFFPMLHDAVWGSKDQELDRLRNASIGFVFQFHHLLPDQDAMHNVMMPALIAGVDLASARRDAEALLSRVGLGDRLTHRPGKLSGGEQQRVAIARALMRKPALLLADEPTGNLDPKTSEEVFDLMVELNRESGSTLIVVTHSQALAQRFDRRLRLEGGRFVEVAQ